MTLVAAVLVVGLLVGAGAGYYLAPTGDDGGGGGGDGPTVIQHPLEGVDVELGYITSSSSGLETMVPFL